MQVMSDKLPNEGMSRCVTGLVKLGQVFSNQKTMAAGAFYTLDEIPGTGVVISINGKPAAEIAEPEFSPASCTTVLVKRPPITA